MKRMLFNATHSEELRVAIVDGQTLLDLDIETLGKEQRKGNIYKGVITRIEPSLEACFVDYGTDRHGFLPFKEVSRAYFQDYEGGKARIQDVLKEGMQIIVQVEKDERGNKGAALTTFISLAGRYLVLMPNNPRGGGVSRRIEGEERQELKAAMAELDVPHGMSIIARTAGIGRSVEELQWDFNYLLQLWRAIEEAANAHKQPYLLFMESSLVIRAIRDYFRPDIGEILVDNQEVYEQVSEFMSYVMPNNLGRLKLYTDHTPLFSRLQIEQQIETAFSRSVSLPSGGAIVIDHTEALVSIDVNSARATRGADIEETAFKTNMEAAEEVARQMRLRDLGGLVVIDFIDMEDARNQREVENTLRDALKKDRARVQMGKLSRFGLLELSRQRLQPALAESSHIACPRCAGTGVIRSIESTALHVLRLIQDAAMKDNTGEVHAQVPVDVATFLLNEKRAELFGMEERLDVSVFLIPNIHLENPHYEITRIRNDDVDENAAPSYKRVSKPEAVDNVPFSNSKGEKAARPEPAVKGVKHASPAPVRESKSWWDGFKGWLSDLFGSDETEKGEQPATQAKGQRSTANRRNNPNRRANKRKNMLETETIAVKEKNNGKNKAEKETGKTANEEKIPLAPAAAEKESRPNTPKAQRQNRNKNKQQEAQQPIQAANADEALLHSENVKQPRNKGKRNKPLVVELGKRQDNRGRNNRQQKSRHIPSAEKINRYLDIDNVAQTVENGIAHVLSQYPDLAEESSLVAAFNERKRLRLLEMERLQAANLAEKEAALIAQSAQLVRDAVDSIVAESEIIIPQITVSEMVSHETAGSKTKTVAAEIAEDLNQEAIQAASTAAEHDDIQTAGTKHSIEHIDAPETQEHTLPDTIAAGACSAADYRGEAVRLAHAAGLELVETSPEALSAAAHMPEPAVQAGLRRSDVPRRVTAAAKHEMIQVETLPH